jgi:hypothetical protein
LVFGKGLEGGFWCLGLFREKRNFNSIKLFEIWTCLGFSGFNKNYFSKINPFELHGQTKDVGLIENLSFKANYLMKRCFENRKKKDRFLILLKNNHSTKK